MRIVNDPSGDYQDSPSVRCNLKRFDDPQDTETVLFYGAMSIFNPMFREYFKDYKKKILLNLWMPTEFNCENPFQPYNDGRTPWQPEGKYLDYFDVIYTICPYTPKWLKEVAGANKYKYKDIWHSYGTVEDYGGSPLDYTKKYDVGYFGGILGGWHKQMATILRLNYNSRICYMYPNEFTTDWGLNTQQKLQLGANTKISVVFATAPLEPKHISSIKSYSDWEKNEAFIGVNDDPPLMPQFKPRILEAAYTKSIILIHRDRWNVIERWFEPDEYVSFTDLNDMKQKIDHILSNYESYFPMIEKAYRRAITMNGEGTVKYIKEQEGLS